MKVIEKSTMVAGRKLCCWNLDVSMLTLMTANMLKEPLKKVLLRKTRSDRQRTTSSRINIKISTHIHCSQYLMGMAVETYIAIALMCIWSKQQLGLGRCILHKQQQLTRTVVLLVLVYNESRYPEPREVKDIVHRTLNASRIVYRNTATFPRSAFLIAHFRFMRRCRRRCI